MPYTKEALLEAVNHMIAETDPRYTLEALQATSTLRARHPVKLSGVLSVLNPLLELQDDNPVGFQRIQGLIDARRTHAGLAPCWPKGDPEKFDKNAYQRQLMAMRRERSGRALAIENMQRTERDRLVGTNRLEYENRQLGLWGEKADILVDEAKKASGGRISRDQIAAIKQRFFESLEVELDEREAAVRAELLKPAHMRQKI
jgi:hypothetical protein